MHNTSHRAFSKRKRPNTLCVNRTYKTLNLELSVVLSVTACGLFLLILMVCLWTSQMDGKWLCHYTPFCLPKVHHHQVLKESQEKCVADVIVLDCFMLWQLVFKNLHLKWVYRILCTVCGTAVLMPLLARQWNPSSVISELDHIAYLNTFLVFILVLLIWGAVLH